MNWIFFLLMFALMIYGVYAIYSATWMIPGQRFWKSQIVWILAALPVFFIVSLVDYRWIRLGAVPCYVLGVVGLVAVLLWGERRYGAQCWLNLGFMSVQPSQFAVLAGIMTIAVYLEATKKISPGLTNSRMWRDRWSPVAAHSCRARSGDVHRLGADGHRSLVRWGGSQEMAYRHAHRWSGHGAR